MELLFQDGHQNVDADGNPDLGLHGVGRCAKEAFDMQILLDPFEEQFDLPTTLVQRGDGQCRQGEIVGQVDEESSGFGVEIADASHSIGISLLTVIDRQLDDLIGTQTTLIVDSQGVLSRKTHTALGTDDEEGTCHGQELVPTRQRPKGRVAVVSGNATLECFSMDKVHHLRKDGLANIHAASHRNLRYLWQASNASHSFPWTTRSLSEHYET